MKELLRLEELEKEDIMKDGKTAGERFLELLAQEFNDDSDIPVQHSSESRAMCRLIDEVYKELKSNVNECKDPRAHWSWS